MTARAGADLDLSFGSFAIDEIATRIKRLAR
jgi:hypothetical protein